MQRSRCIIFVVLTLHSFNSFAQHSDSTQFVTTSPIASDSNTTRKASPFNFLDFRNRIYDSADLSILKPYKQLFKSGPIAKFSGGYLAYNFNYRSSIDTPYVEKNLAQHNVTGQINFVLAGIIPLQSNFWLRKSNSNYFRDIADVQVSFNAGAFRNHLQNHLTQRLLSLESAVRDSASERLYEVKKYQLTDLRKLLNSFGPQSIAEAHEVLRVPRVTWDPYQNDSVNARNEDSIKKVVRLFLDLYEKTKVKYDSLQQEVDSLFKVYEDGRKKVDRYRSLVKGGWKDFVSLRNFESQLKEYGVSNADIPKKYRWLLGLRRFSLGRSTANYSELTSKNISVNGINFEYNSWYYLAVTAGTVNYRFRDFVVRENNRKPQTLLLVRAGIGALERNHFIVSAYRGQKQLFSGNVAGRAALVNISGISAESRWQLNRNSWLTAEVAKSIVPDYRNMPSQGNAKLDFSDRASQGIALRIYSFVPATKTRFEGFYKHTGANFQSFNSFQTNADMESWYLKIDQGLFRKKLRITGSLRKNEFFNPFIVQNYKSNTVFKSISASLRVRKWPVVSVAYQPMSQLTYIGERVAENRFQTLISTLYYLYKISQIRTASTVMLSKFYNNSSDTGFIYYNATYFYWTQQFFFKTFTTHFGVSHTKNSGYMLNVLEGGIQPILKKLGTVGLGVRVNSFNSEVIKVGGYLNAGIRLSGQDILFLNYEHGYLPGNYRKLIRNEMANVQFVKNF